MHTHSCIHCDKYSGRKTSMRPLFRSAYPFLHPLRLADGPGLTLVGRTRSAYPFLHPLRPCLRNSLRHNGAKHTLRAVP